MLAKLAATFTYADEFFVLLFYVHCWQSKFILRLINLDNSGDGGFRR